VGTTFVRDEPSHLIGLPPEGSPIPRVLILGTLPGTEALRLRQYYAAPQNRFWPLIAKLLDADLPLTYNERVALLQDRRIALWDVLASCVRTGASDASIRDGVPNDFSSYLARHPDVGTIGLNGGKAARLFQRLVLDRSALIGHRRVLPLPSTSSTNARTRLPALVAAWSELLV
jgi:hypoxanthine-DNA glycosylase